MTTTAAAVEHLVDEVLEFLGAGPVGLYELVDMQRAPDDSVDMSLARVIARQALAQILRDPDFCLVWRNWADASSTRRADLSDIATHAWDTLTDDPYLAVVAVADV